jgi:GWxTD domain-containing protein
VGNNPMAMKKSILLLVCFGFMLTSFSKTMNLRAYLSYSVFYSPEHGPYLETYLTILGKSVVFVKNDNGRFQGTVLVTMLFKQNDSIKDYRKYELHSPEVDDTTTINFSFLDQQRIPLPSGKYDFELAISDKNQERQPFQSTEVIYINFPSDRISVSGIELVESFQKVTETTALTKNGYDFMPYMDNFYPSSVNKLTYYAEIYNTAGILSDDVYAVTISIRSFETGKTAADLLRVKREKPKAVNVVFGEFDISKLASGNYNLVISVRDKENKELASNELFFQRSNPALVFDLSKISGTDISLSFVTRFQNIDSLREHIRCLFPISSGEEKQFIKYQLKTANLEVMRQFFHIFWASRNQVDPEGEWIKYYDQVLAVNNDFKSATRKGYETDRGRIYLQYGSPNQRVEEQKDPAMYPYEIWQYYKIGKQSDRRFVFYSHDIALNDFELVHSDVLGEVYNPWWQRFVKRGGPSRDPYYEYINHASEREDEYWGGHSSDYYNNPR